MAKPTIIVHGGAGAIHPSLWPQYKDGAHIAAQAGQEILDSGGTAIDAAVAAVVCMEDAPVFNAGTGSALNRDGVVECDALIMTHDRRSGAVAAVTGISNPVNLARIVLENTPHELVVGAGALKLADQFRIERCDPADQIVPRRQQLYDRLIASGESYAENVNPEDASDDPEWIGDSPSDTVGACAMDAQGHFAVASSTGGMMLKHPGRAGDTPVVGAGSYCGPGGAVTCTGHGEAVIRTCLSKYAYDLLEQGVSAREAAQLSVTYLVEAVNGVAGLLMIDRNGKRAWATSTKKITIGIPEEVIDATSGCLEQ